MAGGARAFLNLLALLLLAGGCLLSFFIVLSGGVGGNPINKVYFLQAATGGIGNSPPTAAWTWNSICTYANGLTTACRGAQAAQPFDPVRNFGAAGTLPTSITNHSGFYYAISKAAWALYLVALFFGVIALLFGILSLCSRLVSFLTSFLTFLACLVQAAAAAVMTSWTVLARNAFRGAGIESDLGRYAYGFTWATFVCFFLAMILFCCGGATSRKKDKEEREPTSERVDGHTGFFARNRTSDQPMATTGVKDDYS